VPPLGRPVLLRDGGLGIGQVAPLGEVQPGRAIREGPQRHVDYRQPRLVQERDQRLGDGLTADLGQRAEQVRRLGVCRGRGATRYWRTPSRRLRGAEPALGHAHHGGALAVGDAVEGVHRRRRRRRWAAGWRASRAVVVHHAQALGTASRSALDSGGSTCGGAGHLHPGGEGLVEPEVVPPAHRDQVAEPHVRQLVRDDHLRPEAMPLAGAAGLGVQQEQALPERDQAGVLHGARGEVRHPHQVEFVVGVGRAEPPRQLGQDARRALDSANPERWPRSARRHDPQGTRLAPRPGRASTTSNVADRDGHQVGGESGGVSAKDDLASGRPRASTSRHTGRWPRPYNRRGRGAARGTAP
jgi:hypothetical protein